MRPQTPLKNLYLTGEPIRAAQYHQRSPVIPHNTLQYHPNEVFTFCVAGQDVFLCGFAGALAGALTCGSVILNRNLHLDAISLAKKIKYAKSKED